LLCKIEVWNFKVTTILGRACDVGKIPVRSKRNG
jgi:hypothetical protein